MLVARVERAARAVLGRAVEGLHERAVGRVPDGNALRREVVLRHPDLAAGIDAELGRVVHVQLVVPAHRRLAGMADRPQMLARRREDLHLMRAAAVGDVEIALRIHRQPVRVVEPCGDQRRRCDLAADRQLDELAPGKDGQFVLAREDEPPRGLDRQPRPGPRNEVRDQDLVRRAKRNRQQAVPRGETADLRLRRPRAQRIARQPVFAAFSERRHAELGLLRRLVRSQAADVEFVPGDWLLAVVRREKRRSRPRAADPLAPAGLASVERDEGEAVGSLGDVRADRNRIGGSVASLDERGRLRRGMVGEPCARVVGEAPGRRTRPVDRALVDRLDGLDRDALDDVLARVDETIRNRIKTVPRRVDVAAEIVRTVPLDGLPAGLERARVNQVADATAVLRLEDERGEAVKRHFKGNVDAVGRLVGLERPAKRLRRGRGGKDEDLVEMNQRAALRAIGDMGMQAAIRGRRGDPESQAARRHRLPEVEPGRAQRGRIAVPEARERAHRPPVALFRVLRMDGGACRAHLHVHGVEEGEVEADRRERRRRAPGDAGARRIRLRDRLAVCLVLPLVPVVDLAVDETRRLARIRTRERRAERRDVHDRLGEEVERAEPCRIPALLVLHPILGNRRFDADLPRLRPCRHIPEGVALAQRLGRSAAFLRQALHAPPFPVLVVSPGERDLGIARVETAEGDRRGEFANRRAFARRLGNAERVAKGLRRATPRRRQRPVEKVRRLRARHAGRNHGRLQATATVLGRYGSQRRCENESEIKPHRHFEISRLDTFLS